MREEELGAARESALEHGAQVGAPFVDPRAFVAFEEQLREYGSRVVECALQRFGGGNV